MMSSLLVKGRLLETVLLLMSFSLTALAGVCPYGWRDYTGGSSCYLITYYQVRYNFDRAADQCRAHQAQLINIDDQNEMDWLGKEIQQLSRAGLPPKMAWWVGLEDAGQGQGVKNINGSDVNVKILPWSGGAPPAASTSRRCAAVVNSTTVMMSDCNSWFGLLCERSKDLPLSCDVENAWVFINGSCFKYFSSPQTWFLAKSTCEQVEAALARVSTAEEVGFIWDQAKVSSSMSWIGLKSNIQTRTYLWTDGSTVDSSIAWWSNYQPQDLTYMMYTDPDLCGMISGNGTRRLASWMTQDCNGRYPFTCSKPQGVCTDGWISHQGICIKFFPQQLMSWISARRFCQAMAADLIVIPTQLCQDLVNTYLRALRDAGIDSFWLGVQDSTNHTFEWVDSTYAMNWTNWAVDTPGNTPGTHEVAYISTGDKAGKWQLTSELSTRRAVACFISGTKTVKDISPPLSDYQCLDHWEIAGDTCVYLSHDDATWSQADNNCQKLQSQLLVVNSVDVQSFLNSRVTTGQFWIGLSDRSTEGIFVWVNGTQLNRTYWASGQPDNRGDENCVVAKASSDGVHWFDTSCQEQSTYICQRQPLNKPGPSFLARTAAPYSVKCGVMWEERPGTNFCYQFRDTPLSWSDALETCSSFNGSLVSIVSRDEQSYVEGRLNALSSVDIWIGASDRRREAGWEWEDGSPFAYLNWHPGEPNDQSIENCAAISSHTMMWFDYPCNLRTGSVCKKTADNSWTSTTLVRTAPTSLPSGQYFGCSLGWLVYDNNCYLMRRESVTWTDAETACRREGGSLASIGSDLENKFVWSQLPKESCQNTHANDSQCQAWADAMECQKNPTWMSLNCRLSCSMCTQTCVNRHTHYECKFWASIGECLRNPDWMWPNCAFSCGCDTSINEGYWLGLNDRHSQMTFVWDNLSPVTFTNWLPNEPNNYEGKHEDCVKIHTTDGGWSDEVCDQKNAGYICKKKMAILSTPTIDPNKIGCPISGFGYGGMCFVIIDTPKTWLDARSYCSMQNATLATIPDSITGAFITSELVHKTASYWIGLNNRGGTYIWDSGSRIQYLAWSPSHTGNENNTCVAIRSQKPVGLWEDLKCQNLQPFICEILARDFTQTTTSTTSSPPTLAQCPSSWQGEGEQCYKMFFSSKNWFDAEADCERYGGSLASIHDDITNEMIKSLTGWSLAGGYWIGLSDLDKESSYRWSDGSPFDYSRWASGEPNHATIAEDCVEEIASTMDWNDISCYLSRPYVCSVVRGAPVFSAAPAVSTTQAPSCKDEDWKFYGGFCYYISPDFGKNSSLTWFESRRRCQMMGGDLVSIASEDENNFLTTKLSLQQKFMFWTGLNQLEQLSYVWSDGIPLSFVAWGPKEPNDVMGGERCVAMDGDRGVWQDNECMTDHGYVCKKLNGSSTPLFPVTTPAYSGACPDGFVSGVGSKCYYIGGSGNISWEDPKRSWEDARDWCRNMSSAALVDIGSIHSLKDQDVVTSLLWDLDSNLWIGLSDRLVANQYLWQDNSEVIYTNWASGQPVRHSPWDSYKDNCIEMLREPHRAEDTAKWNDSPCSKKNAFLCQTMKSPTSASSTTSVGPITSSGCPATFFLYKSTCYSVIDEPRSWLEARQSCQSFHGDLASTSDIFEVARLDLAMLSSGVTGQAWIGLKYDQNSSQYVWSNGWPVVNVFWSSADPDHHTNDSCVAFSQASWNDTSCSELLPAICEIKSETAPIPSPTSSGQCADPSHVTFGDFCYLARPNESLSWPEASYRCGKMGMELVSVHSAAENNFLMGYVDHVSALATGSGFFHGDVWLGLHKDLEGGFRWSDKSPATYFNWDDGEPSSLTSGMADEQCVLLFRESGRWNDLPCLGQRLGYVCQTSKMFPNTNMPSTQFTLSTGATSPQVVTLPQTTSSNVVPTLHSSPGSQLPLPHSLTPVHSPLGKNEITLSGGQIAGIVIGVLGFCVIFAVIVIVLKNRQKPIRYGPFPKSTQGTDYDNALYTQEQDGQSGEMTEEVVIGSSSDVESKAVVSDT